MPRGNRPSMAAFTSVGERNASDIVILTCRTLHFSRAAISSTWGTEPVQISSRQRRPQEMDVTSVTRVSNRIGRANDCHKSNVRHTQGLYGILISACVSCFIQDPATFGLITVSYTHLTLPTIYSV